MVRLNKKNSEFKRKTIKKSALQISMIKKSFRHQNYDEDNEYDGGDKFEDGHEDTDEDTPSYYNTKDLIYSVFC